MTFSKRDSALRDKAGSLWLASSIDTQVLSPYSPLHNPAFSSQNKRSGASVSSQVSLEILESQNGFTKQAQNLESTFQQSSHSPTAIPRILEEENQSSLRDFALAKSWQSNSAPAESNQINGARKACNLESVQGDWGVKGGIRGDASQVAPLSPLERTLSQAKIESSNNAKKVDSSVDCHASTTALARNDSKNAKTQKVDSRFFTQTTQPAHHDSKNCGGALRVFEKFRAGVTLSGNDCPKFFKPRESLTQS